MGRPELPTTTSKMASRDRQYGTGFIKKVFPRKLEPYGFIRILSPIQYRGWEAAFYFADVDLPKHVHPYVRPGLVMQFDLIEKPKDLMTSPVYFRAISIRPIEIMEQHASLTSGPRRGEDGGTGIAGITAVLVYGSTQVSIRPESWAQLRTTEGGLHELPLPGDTIIVRFTWKEFLRASIERRPPTCEIVRRLPKFPQPGRRQRSLSTSSSSGNRLRRSVGESNASNDPPNCQSERSAVGDGRLSGGDSGAPSDSASTDNDDLSLVVVAAGYASANGEEGSVGVQEAEGEGGTGSARSGVSSRAARGSGDGDSDSCGGSSSSSSRNNLEEDGGTACYVVAAGASVARGCVGEQERQTHEVASIGGGARGEPSTRRPSNVEPHESFCPQDSQSSPARTSAATVAVGTSVVNGGMSIVDTPTRGDDRILLRSLPGEEPPGEGRTSRLGRCVDVRLADHRRRRSCDGPYEAAQRREYSAPPVMSEQQEHVQFDPCVRSTWLHMEDVRTRGLLCHVPECAKLHKHATANHFYDLPPPDHCTAVSRNLNSSMPIATTQPEQWLPAAHGRDSSGGKAIQRITFKEFLLNGGQLF